MSATIHNLREQVGRDLEPMDAVTDAYLQGLSDGQRHTRHALIWLTAIVSCITVIAIVQFAIWIGSRA